MLLLRWIAYAVILISAVCGVYGLFEGPFIFLVSGISGVISGLLLLAAAEAVDTLMEISQTLKDRLPAVASEDEPEALPAGFAGDGDVASLDELQSRIDQMKS